MNDLFLYGEQILPYSITNLKSDPQFAQDQQAPFSFFDFLKHATAIQSPREFNNAYQVYLKNWYEVKNTAADDKT